MSYDLVILFEHPEWQKPLFAALDRRGVRYGRFDLKHAAFDPFERVVDFLESQID